MFGALPVKRTVMDYETDEVRYGVTVFGSILLRPA